MPQQEDSPSSAPSSLPPTQNTHTLKCPVPGRLLFCGTYCPFLLTFQVHVGNEEFLHLRVFKSLPHENKPLSLSSYQSSKTKHDELTYF
uniref:Uncharacterized protein n=1 Tax=Chrysemys picta bellii TaxID=8478 RepID=A0A8C3EZ36_CHRPI